MATITRNAIKDAIQKDLVTAPTMMTLRKHRDEESSAENPVVLDAKEGILEDLFEGTFEPRNDTLHRIVAIIPETEDDFISRWGLKRAGCASVPELLKKPQWADGGLKAALQQNWEYFEKEDHINDPDIQKGVCNSCGYEKAPLAFRCNPRYLKMCMDRYRSTKEVSIRMGWSLVPEQANRILKCYFVLEE